ncbi:MAG: GNAT family N-acetyltransferase [Tannerellaceae bacterium]|jgi:hypothetical protein|nr:GNAT family N-acetyltransferase [Tannerellaceae bacterium]
MTNKEKYRLLSENEPCLPIFSRNWWLDTVCGAANWDVLLVEKNERILAAMPLYTPCPHVVSMPPFTQTMGPWFAPEDEGEAGYAARLERRQAICKGFVRELERYRAFLQNFNYRITDWLPFYWRGYTQTTRYTYLLDGIGEPDILWRGMSLNIRRNITKAKGKYRITVKRGIPVDEFMRVYALTFSRQRKQPPGRDVLKRLIAVCRDRGQGDLWGGYDGEGRLHAAAFIVWQAGGSAYYIAGGADPALRGSGAHALVLWEGIQAVSAFTSLFDFEGSMIPGVERFFRGFGGKQTPFFTISKGKISLFDRARSKLGRLLHH